MIQLKDGSKSTFLRDEGGFIDTVLLIKGNRTKLVEAREYEDDRVSAITLWETNSPWSAGMDRYEFTYESGSNLPYRMDFFWISRDSSIVNHGGFELWEWKNGNVIRQKQYLKDGSTFLETFYEHDHIQNPKNEFTSPRFVEFWNRNNIKWDSTYDHSGQVRLIPQPVLTTLEYTDQACLKSSQRSADTKYAERKCTYVY